MAARRYPRWLLPALVLLLSILVLWASHRDRATQAGPRQTRCSDAVSNRILGDLAAKAVDQAFQDHISSLYNTWMRETHDEANQMERIQRGMDKAIDAYLKSKQAIQDWRERCQ